MDDCTISREREAERVIFHLAGSFDRAGAWDLRARLDGEATPEVLLDFSLVREFSDLGLAVVAHGLIAGLKHVHFRGVCQHQLRIFQYCGVPIHEVPAENDAGPARSLTPFTAQPRA
ncbi:MAG TPA: STAS domain-containing protein [Anaeromyxobacteraceae bacterium]|nr:STAS domain-containing protein [Anaeromyxobacteraceae bacterium]